MGLKEYADGIDNSAHFIKFYVWVVNSAILMESHIKS